MLDKIQYKILHYNKSKLIPVSLNQDEFISPNTEEKKCFLVFLMHPEVFQQTLKFFKNIKKETQHDDFIYAILI